MLRGNNVGSILKKARERSNLTQQELANRAFLTRQSISKYELNVSHMSVENFLLLLDILGTSVLFKDGEIKILEEKNMSTRGYLKINAQTAKEIASSIESVSDIFSRNDIKLVNMFELKEVLSPNSEGFASLDNGFYLTIDFSDSKINKNYLINQSCENYIKNPVYKLLHCIEETINKENVSFTTFYPASIYEEIVCGKTEFKDIDLIKVKMKNFYKSFNPVKYDKIFPTPRAGYQRVKKDGKYGFIDCFTGKETVPCKFDFVEAFDYQFKDHEGNMICRARLNGQQIVINESGEIVSTRFSRVN